MIANLFFDWRWVEAGEGFGIADGHSIWLLPKSMRIEQVNVVESELLDLIGNPARFTLRTLPHYSTDIGAAWTLVDGYDGVELRLVGGKWSCRLVLAPGRSRGVSIEATAVAEAAPLAICRAAYRAMRAR